MQIAVLDYNKGEVIIKDIPRKFENLDEDDICVKMGFQISNVEYMIVEDTLPIEIDTDDYIII